MSGQNYLEHIYRDAFFSDDLELLPGGYTITNGNLRKFYDSENFILYDEDNKDINLILDNESIEGFRYYYGIWENYHYFGLPNNQGWIKEPPWLLNFFKYFDGIYEEIKVFRSKKGA